MCFRFVSLKQDVHGRRGSETVAIRRKNAHVKEVAGRRRSKAVKGKVWRFCFDGTDHTSLFLWDKLSAPSHCKTFFDNPQNILPPSSSVAPHVPTQKTTTACVHKSQKRPCPLTPCPAFDVSSSYPLNTSANRFFFVPSFYSKSVDAFSFPSDAHNSYFQLQRPKIVQSSLTPFLYSYFTLSHQQSLLAQCLK